MKKKVSILLSLALMFITCISFGQNARITKEGNYTCISKKTGKKPNSFAKNTGKIFTDCRGTVWPVYINTKGIFVLRISGKNGNTYRKYLRL